MLQGSGGKMRRSCSRSADLLLGGGRLLGLGRSRLLGLGGGGLLGGRLLLGRCLQHAST